MAYSTIEVERDGALAILRLSDPATLNAVTIQMIEEINDALDALTGTTRSMVVTGAGRAFCSGANLSGGLMDTQPADQRDAGGVLESHINPLMLRLRDLPFPWISAVKGSAAGVGCSLALAADLIVAGESAFFLQAFARIGLVPDGGSSWLLPRAVGRTRAMEMMLLGERIPAAKALEWGMINRVRPDEHVLPTAIELAKSLAAGPTRSLAMIRRLSWSASELTFDAALKSERESQRDAGRTTDHAEGVAAFLAKRPANFTGA